MSLDNKAGEKKNNTEKRENRKLPFVSTFYVAQRRLLIQRVESVLTATAVSDYVFAFCFFFCVAGRKRAIPFPLDSTLLLWPWSRERQGYKPGSSSKHVRRTTEENEDREKETRMHTRNGTMTSRCRCCLLLLLLLLLCYVVAWRDECSRPPTNDLPALKPLLSITSSTSFTLEFVREFFSSSYP